MAKRPCTSECNSGARFSLAEVLQQLDEYSQLDDYFSDDEENGNGVHNELCMPGSDDEFGDCLEPVMQDEAEEGTSTNIHDTDT